MINMDILVRGVVFVCMRYTSSDTLNSQLRLYFLCCVVSLESSSDVVLHSVFTVFVNRGSQNMISGVCINREATCLRPRWLVVHQHDIRSMFDGNQTPNTPPPRCSSGP